MKSHFVLEIKRWSQNYNKEPAVVQFGLTAVMLLLTEERMFFPFSLGGNLKT